jgi:hypothetical protein
MIKTMKVWNLFVVTAALVFASVARADIPAEKRQEIETMLRLTGMEKLVNQMKVQMIAGLRSNMDGMSDVFWEKFSAKMDAKTLIDKIIPLYDKYYTVEDLRAVNAFYSSPAGQKVLSTLPQLMQESMKVGQEWGREIGEQAAAEAAAERAANKKE